MDFSQWSREYKKICKELKIDVAKDEEAADIMSRLMKERRQPLEKLKGAIKGKNAIIFGAGPSLDEELAIRLSTTKNSVLIAADGTTSALLKEKITPEVIVTDLDGNMKDIAYADNEGAILVVHAHGDNIKALGGWVPKLKNVVASCQVKPRENVRNFFGFTDGDRAVFLAKHFNARDIVLVGFDFGNIVGRYSDPEKPYEHKASEVKEKKLAIARRLIEIAAKD